MTYVEANVHDIVVTMRRKTRGKIIHVDVTSAHMDNMSFHSKTIVQKWEYVPQIRITAERELGEGTLDCIEIMKATGIMKIVTDDGPSCENLINGIRKVYDRGKSVKLSPSSIN